MHGLTVIHIERLREGQEEHIEARISPSFLKGDNDTLFFEKEVFVEGKIYIAGEHLVLQLEIEAFAEIPCKICNTQVTTPLHLKNFYITKPLEEIPSGVFDFCEHIREEILLEAPPFSECASGNCPKRAEIDSYSQKEPSSEEETHYPFKDL